MNGLTVEQLARRNLLPSLLPQVLLDERQRGNVERRGKQWVASEGLVREFGPAFAYVQPQQRERT
jgi:hypothetical protein